MSLRSPLDHPRLKKVDALLSDRALEQAQELLASLNPDADLADGVAYLATRLLYLRGRLDTAGVIERLEELLARSAPFPEAMALLQRARKDQLTVPPPPATDPSAVEPRRAAASAPPRTHEPSRIHEPSRTYQPSRADSASVPPVLSIPSGRQSDVSELLRRTSSHPPADPAPLDLPNIPRAPAVPAFTSPASYAREPHQSDQSAGSAPHASATVRAAGRYSRGPQPPETVRPERASSIPARPRPSSLPGPTRESASTAPQRAASSAPPPSREGGLKRPIRSGYPAGHAADAPTLAQLATWLDQARFGEVIEAIDQIGSVAEPELVLVRARALLGQGHRQLAREALGELEREPLLDPEVRAATARAWVELGDTARALREARRARDDEPTQSLIALTFALAALRHGRATDDVALVNEAKHALRGLGPVPGPHPALVQGLEAYVQARVGDPKRALSYAQKALALDPLSVDAIAAIAVASARLSQPQDSRRAWRKLQRLSEDEADSLADVLTDLGAPVGTGATSISFQPDPWHPAETALVAEDRGTAIAMLELQAQDLLARVRRPGVSSAAALPALGSLAAGFLESAPIFGSFAPYDLSLWGLYRLDAALAVLYGPGGRATIDSDASAMLDLLAAYLGETLRVAHGASWESQSSQGAEPRIVAGQRSWAPLELVTARLVEPGHRRLVDALSSALSRRESAPWSHRIPSLASAFCPWSGVWPNPSELPRLARALGRSAVHLYCEQVRGPLDLSVASLQALDEYVDLIAPAHAPEDPEASWTWRNAGLCGAYLGEALRAAVGGEWIYGVDRASAAADFRLLLDRRVEATPVAAMLERFTHKTPTLPSEYAKTLLRRLGRA